MVTTNLGHHHITDGSKQGKICPALMETITGNFSKISLDGRNNVGISLDAGLQVPKPKSLHWVGQRQRVNKGELKNILNYDINKKIQFPFNFQAANDFKGSPGQLKTGARLRLGPGQARDSKLGTKRTLNFSSTQVKTETQPKTGNKSVQPTDIGGARAEKSGGHRQSDDDRKKADPPPDQGLRCDGCGVQSSSSRKLERHKRIFHDYKAAQNDSFKSMALKCFQCRKNFSGVAKLLIHKNSHTGKLKPGGVCNLCKSRFDDIKRHHLEKHILEDEKKGCDNEVVVI